jgi:hypothetical protein
MIEGGNRLLSFGLMRRTPESLGFYGTEAAVLKPTVNAEIKQAPVVLANAANSQNRQPVQEYDIGEYKDLQDRSDVGDHLDLHHVPQKHPAGQVIPGYRPETGTAIALNEVTHRAIPRTKGTYTGTPRQLLGNDAWNLRQAGVANTYIERLLNMAKAQFPTSYVRPPRAPKTQ